MEASKQYYLMVRNTMTGLKEKVEVSEEIYRAYVRPARREQKQKQRDQKCQVLGESGKLVRCVMDCACCEYAQSGKKPIGAFLSLDRLIDSGYDFADDSVDVEKEYWAKHDRQRVRDAISKLTSRQQEMISLYYYEEKTEQEIAEYYGVTQQAVNNAMQKILRRLKKII